VLQARACTHIAEQALRQPCRKSPINIKLQVKWLYQYCFVVASGKNMTQCLPLLPIQAVELLLKRVM
jgi:hypothetical protein